MRAGELRVVRVVAADPEQAENAVQGRAHVVAYAAEEVGPRPRRRLGERGLELLLVLLFCGDRVVDIHEDADGGVGEAVLVAAELRGVAPVRAMERGAFADEAATSAENYRTSSMRSSGYGSPWSSVSRRSTVRNPRAS